MVPSSIQSALDRIGSEPDPSVRALLLASLVTATFLEHGIELVVVGGSAIELLTEGAYTSGDIDLCLLNRTSVGLRERQEIFGRLHAVGGPRNWKVAGLHVDLLGPVESVARTPFRVLDGPYGPIRLMQPEELLVERILVSEYPGPHPPARDCARKLAAVALKGGIEMDWTEVARIAALPEYRSEESTRKLLEDVRRELGTHSTPDPNGPADLV